MFSPSVSAEPEVLRLWRQESDLAIRRQAALDRASAAAREAGERYLESEAPEEAVSSGAEAVTRALSEGTVLAASTVATRKRRQAALEKQLGEKVDALRAYAAAKQRELDAISSKRNALLAELAQVEGAPMAALPSDGYKPPRSHGLSQEIAGINAQIDALERAGVRLTGEIVGDSVADLLGRMQEQASRALVPSAYDTEQWAVEVEAQVSAARPDLLRGDFQVPTKIVTETPHGRHYIGGRVSDSAGVIPTGPARHVPYRATYSVRFDGGMIDRRASFLRFPQTADFDRGPATFYAAGESAQK
jgi:hypothetical protein